MFMYPAIKNAMNWAKEAANSYQSRKKLSLIKKNVSSPILNAQPLNEYRKQWAKLDKNASCHYPRIFSAINGLSSADYVPENVYYNKIEPVLNNKAFATAYADKNFYERYLIDFKDIFPTTLIRKINGTLLDKDYRRLYHIDDLCELFQNDYLILKPAIETSGGSDVKLVKQKNSHFYLDSNHYTIDEFFKFLTENYVKSFVLQQILQQNEWFSHFNPSSVNTVRIFTYRSVSDDNVYPLHAVIRFGQKGSIVDNQAAGGLSCGVDCEGKINGFAVDKYGTVYDKVPAIMEKTGSLVPGINQMKSIASKISSQCFYHRILAFDFCYDNKGKVRLLEINFKNIETNFLQMNNGPLFGRFTSEVIDYCLKNKKSLVFDFYV